MQVGRGEAFRGEDGGAFAAPRPSFRAGLRSCSTRGGGHGVPRCKHPCILSTAAGSCSSMVEFSPCGPDMLAS